MPGQGIVASLDTDEILLALYLSLHRCAFLLLENGLFAIGPDCARIGDKVCIVYGTTEPVLLREEEDEEPSGCDGSDSVRYWKLISGSVFVWDTDYPSPDGVDFSSLWPPSFFEEHDYDLDEFYVK